MVQDFLAAVRIQIKTITPRLRVITSRKNYIS
jgi:hypothetical protein